MAVAIKELAPQGLNRSGEMKNEYRAHQDTSVIQLGDGPALPIFNGVRDEGETFWANRKDM